MPSHFMIGVRVVYKSERAEQPDSGSHLWLHQKAGKQHEETKGAENYVLSLNLLQISTCSRTAAVWQEVERYL